MGFKTEVIIWDFYSGCKLGQYCNHLTRVNAVKFSHDGRYLFSIGNMDDGYVCLYDMEKCCVITTYKAIQGRNGIPRVVACTNTRNDVWAVGGDDYMSYWILDKDKRLRPERANLRMIKRDILSMVIDGCDEYAYCGTSTGDIIKVRLNLPDLWLHLRPTGSTRTSPIRPLPLHRDREEGSKMRARDPKQSLVQRGRDGAQNPGVRRLCRRSRKRESDPGSPHHRLSREG